MPIVLKSGSLKLLEPSGPVQACNGIALLMTWCSVNCVFIWYAVVKIHVRHISMIRFTLYSDTEIWTINDRGQSCHPVASNFSLVYFVPAPESSKLH